MEGISSIYEQVTMGEDQPQWGCTSWAGAVDMANKLGIKLPDHLVPGMPVIMMRGGMMETFYG